jgi:hypothetical protein
MVRLFGRAETPTPFKINNLSGFQAFAAIRRETSGDRGALLRSGVTE